MLMKRDIMPKGPRACLPLLLFLIAFLACGCGQAGGLAPEANVFLIFESAAEVRTVSLAQADRVELAQNAGHVPLHAGDASAFVCRKRRKCMSRCASLQKQGKRWANRLHKRHSRWIFREARPPCSKFQTMWKTHCKSNTQVEETTHFPNRLDTRPGTWYDSSEIRE